MPATDISLAAAARASRHGPTVRFDGRRPIGRATSHHRSTERWKLLWEGALALTRHQLISAKPERLSLISKALEPRCVAVGEPHA